MSDNAKSSGDAKSAAPPREMDTAGRPVARLINATVRDYMDTLSLQRFYGGYVITKIDEQVFNLGIGEVGGIDLPEDTFPVKSVTILECHLDSGLYGSRVHSKLTGYRPV